jgi:DNA repair protein SbcD/Mre11
MAMKILHFADVHLGAAGGGRTDPRTNLSTRISDSISCLNFIVDAALEQQVDLALFAGDAYRSSDPSPTLQTFFLKPILRLLHENIPVVLILGNHDLPGALTRAHSLEIAHLFSLPNLHVLDRPTALLRVATKAGEVGIIGLPWVKPLRMLSDAEVAKKSGSEITELLSERLSQTLREYMDEAPSDIPLIVVAHQAVLGSTRPGTEKSMLWGDVPLLPLHLLTDERLAYSALGHQHNYEDLSPRGPVHAVYAGSPDRYDFSDEDVAKGFVIAELEGKYFTPVFHPTPARRLLTLEMKLKAEDDLGELLARKISVDAITDAIVRLRLSSGTGHLTDSKMEAVHRALQPAHSFTIEVAAPPRATEQAFASFGLDLSPKSAVEDYIKLHANDLGDLGDEVQDYALKLIAGMEGNPQ